MTVEDVRVLTAVAVFGTIGVGLLAWVSLVKPRALLYVILALVPTQFIFIPVSDFFLSPADVLVLGAAAGLTVRLIAGDIRARRALGRHMFLGIMVVGYVVGFLVLGHFSRTLVRVPMAIVPSVLACELLHDRVHLAHATGALVIAGLVDAGYGAYFYAGGTWLHPTRFSGMMGVNFSATIIATAAVITLARRAGTREPVKLILPGILTAFAVATLSKMALIALVVAWTLLLSRMFTRTNRRLVMSAVLLVTLVVLSQGTIRERFVARALPELQQDGVVRSSTAVRWLILRMAWRGFLDHPLVGVGYFNFQKYSTRDPAINASTFGEGYGTHNTYAEVLVEGGLLAFVPFLLHFVQYARGTPRVWRLVTHQHDVIIVASIAGLPVMAIAAGLANVLLHYAFWSVCGAALAGLTLVRSEVGDEHEAGRTPAAI